jgi:hypothetical protein
MVSSLRSVGGSTVFRSILECSWRWGGRHSRRFLESVSRGASFTWPLRFLESVPPGDVLSHRCSGQWCLSGDVKPLCLDICWSVDHLDTWYWKPPGVALGSPGESWVGLRGWAVTGIRRYPGYKTPTQLYLPIEYYTKCQLFRPQSLCIK